MATSRRAPPCATCSRMRCVTNSASSRSLKAAVQLDRLAARAARPELLAEAAGVVRDEAVGGLEDGAGRAVVLLEAVNSAHPGNRGGTAVRSLRARRASRRSTDRRQPRRRAAGPSARCSREEDTGSRGSDHRTGWRWCPGTHPPARAGSAAGNARAAPGCRATARRRAAAARRSRRRPVRSQASS